MMMGYESLLDIIVGRRMIMNAHGFVKGRYEPVKLRSVLESVGLGYRNVEDSHLYERLADVYKHLSDFPAIDPLEAEEGELETERIINAMRILRERSDDPDKISWIPLNHIVESVSGDGNGQTK